jgi:hypothetical protein
MMPRLLIILVLVLMKAVLCPAEDRARHMMLNDPAVKALPAVAALETEVLDDINGVLWWLDGREKYTVDSVAFEDPKTGKTVPARTETLGAPRNCYALMIDDSLSMVPFRNNALAAMKQVLQKVPDGEFAGLYSFSGDLTLHQPFVPVQEITDGGSTIDGIEFKGRDTQLYLAVTRAAADLTNGPAVRGHMIVFSDGDAEDLAVTIQEAIGYVNARRVVVHTVGFAPAGKTGTALKMEVLRRLSTDTGGLYHFFSSLEDLERAFDDVFALHGPDTMGVALPRDLHTLEYGLDSLDLVITARDVDGLVHVFKLPAIPIQGTTTLENALVSIAARSHGVNPWVILAAIPSTLVLILVLILVSRVRRKRRLTARETARHEAEKKRLEQIKKEQARKEAEVQKALTQITHKLDTFQPEEKVMAQGTPYGRLIDPEGEAYELISYSTRIGRDPDENDVVLPDEHISASHAILDLKRGRFIWTDRAPMNPTLINDQPVQGSREILPGDVIVCGETRLQFVLELVDN